LTSGFGLGISGIVGWTGTGGSALCSRANVGSSLYSADPTENIVPRVSFEAVLRSWLVLARVLGKEETGKPSTRSSR
jgi:hypothetical protein